MSLMVVCIGRLLAASPVLPDLPSLGACRHVIGQLDYRMQADLHKISFAPWWVRETAHYAKYSKVGPTRQLCGGILDGLRNGGTALLKDCRRFPEHADEQEAG